MHLINPNNIPIGLIEHVLRSRIQAPPFEISKFCFKEQLDFIQDFASFKTAVCSRRAGKTVACAADLIDTALKFPRVACLYITLSRTNAKRIIWPELLRINQEFFLKGKPHNSELSLTFPNGSVIYVSGGKDKSQIENFRGFPIKKAYIDESQAFRSYIQELVDDVISKSLFDYNGQLCLIGTPGVVPAGYFYDCSKNKAWSHHHWTMFQNPFLEQKSQKKVMELVLADCARMGVSIDHPKIQRECYGRWVVDMDSMVFKYDSIKNDYSELPTVASKWESVVAVDVGHDDADAISVIQWNQVLKEAYLVEEQIDRKQGVTELANKLEKLVDKHDPLKVVMDTGGLGKKIAEEIRKRFKIPVEAADKHRKFEFIELLNDAMRTGKFKAKKESAFAEDCMMVEWDRDVKEPGKLKISDRYHSDICFIAGTQVDTETGPKPIESIQVGEKVLTRNGYKPITASGMTSESAEIMELEFSNGSVIQCTPNHPFFTRDRGFMRADALLYSDRFVINTECAREFQKKAWLSGITDNLLSGIRSLKEFILEIISGLMTTVKGMRFIEPFGLLIMGLFQKACKFTIKTATRLTTILKISNVLRWMSTGIIIGKKPEKKVTKTSNTWIEHEKKLKNGTGLKKVLNGIANTLCIGVRNIEKKLRQFAQYAVNATKGIPYQKRPYFTALTNVEPKLDVIPDWTISRLYARFAKRFFYIINTANESIAVGLVRRELITEKKPVYNISVEEIPEYFANGILVHNCDSVLYGFRECLHWLYEEPKVQPVKGSPEWLEKHEKELEDSLIYSINNKNDRDKFEELDFNLHDDYF